MALKVSSFESLIQSYLSNRRVKLTVNGFESRLSTNHYINCGVPQGSILGSLMFLIYINDLPDNLSANKV